MIYDSFIWKNELKKVYKSIKRNSEKKYTEKRDFILEKNLFLSAFIVRKLIESNKMSDYIDNYSININYYRPIKLVDRLHCYVDDEMYDFEQKETKNISLKTLCNSLIHSYVFSTMYDENKKFLNFYVSSDFDRNQVLYEVDISIWLNVLKKVINDDVVRMESHYDVEKKEYISTKKDRRED